MDKSKSNYELLDISISCNIIPVGFRNLLPNGTKVEIIEIESKITYDDGSTEKLGPKRVVIKPGGSDEVLMSACTEKNATSIWGKLTVWDTQGGGDRKVVLEKVRNADPGGRLAMANFPLGKS